jgi:hypothetical protein
MQQIQIIVVGMQIIEIDAASFSHPHVLGRHGFGLDSFLQKSEKGRIQEIFYNPKSIPMLHRPRLTNNTRKVFFVLLHSLVNMGQGRLDNDLFFIKQIKQQQQ